MLHRALSRPKKDDEVVGMMLIYHRLFKEVTQRNPFQKSQAFEQNPLDKQATFYSHLLAPSFCSYQPEAIKKKNIYIYFKKERLRKCLPKSPVLNCSISGWKIHQKM